MVDLTLAVEGKMVLGRKFETPDIDPSLNALAARWLAEWEPTGNMTDEFLSSVKRQMYRYGLSAAQAKGVLNCAVASFEYAQREREKPAEAVDGENRSYTPNGTYTVILNGDDTDYVTLRLSDNFLIAKGKAKPGSQQVEYLYGSDNERSFKGFGFVRGTAVHPWSSGRHLTRQIQAAEMLLSKGWDVWEEREAYALRSGRCGRCGKTLTVPVSLHRGLGPVCYAVVMGDAEDGED